MYVVPIYLSIIITISFIKKYTKKSWVFVDVFLMYNIILQKFVRLTKPFF